MKEKIPQELEELPKRNEISLSVFIEKNAEKTIEELKKKRTFLEKLSTNFRKEIKRQ